MSDFDYKEKLIQFDTFFTKYYAPLLYFIDSYIRSREESADIVQNTFVKLWEQGDLTSGHLYVRSFLFTVARNMALDTLKHRKVRQQFLNEETDKYQQMERELHENALREFKAFSNEKKLLKRKVKLLVMKLPLSDRRIFVMSKYNNLTNREIAEILQISIKTVEKRLKLSLLFIKRRIIIFIF